MRPRPNRKKGEHFAHVGNYNGAHFPSMPMPIPLATPPSQGYPISPQFHAMSYFTAGYSSYGMSSNGIPVTHYMPPQIPGQTEQQTYPPFMPPPTYQAPVFQPFEQPDRSNVPSTQPAAGPANANVYIRGLTTTSTDEDLYALASKYGKIVSVKAIKDHSTTYCKGFGFVLFETPLEASRCVEGLFAEGYIVSYAKESLTARLKKLSDETTTNLYISNLPLSVTEDDLEGVFKEYGVISKKILVEKATNVSRGVGFVRLATRENAQLAINNLNDQTVFPNSGPIHIRFADNEAQKRLKTQVQLGRKFKAGFEGLVYYSGNGPPSQASTNTSNFSTASPNTPPTG